MYRLYKAVETGDLEKIAYLIDVEGVDVNCRAHNFDGFDSFTTESHFYNFYRHNTPLYIAILNEDYSTVNLLLEKGASVNKIDKDGHSALEIILESNYCNDHFDALINAIVKKSLNMDHVVLNKIISKYQQECLHFDMYKKLELVIKYLIENKNLTADEVGQLKNLINTKDGSERSQGTEQEISRLKLKITQLEATNQSLQHELTELKKQISPEESPVDDYIFLRRAF